jgi:hypothetical protein
MWSLWKDIFKEGPLTGMSIRFLMFVTSWVLQLNEALNRDTSESVSTHNLSLNVRALNTDVVACCWGITKILVPNRFDVKSVREASLGAMF